MILDTSYVVDLITRDEGAFQKGLELHEASVTRRLPTPVFFEAFYGAEYLDDPDERRRVRNALLGYPTVPVTDQTARSASLLRERADRAPGGDSGVEVNDASIAATATDLDESVLTANVSDFERLGVDVETY